MERNHKDSLYRQSIDTATATTHALEESLRSSMAQTLKNQDLELEIALALHNASQDELTKLLNRRAFEEEYTKLEFSEPGNFTLIAVDLDDMKEINDTKGHLAGDDLLVSAAGVFHEGLRTNHDPDYPDRELDVVAAARIGGDEFLVLLREVNNIETMAKIIDRLRARFDTVGIRASIGGTIHRTGVDFAQLIKEADDNMYKDKNHRKGILARSRGSGRT